MGIYVNKVISKSVQLMNGEMANIAVFAYKDAWDVGDAHVKSGAHRCDLEAARGKRHSYIVRGFVEADGTISINRKAYKSKCGPIGSFTEDFAIAEVDAGGVDVVLNSRVKKIKFSAK